MLMLDLWLQAETPGVTHFGAYHRPPDGHFIRFQGLYLLAPYKRIMYILGPEIQQGLDKIGSLQQIFGASLHISSTRFHHHFLKSHFRYLQQIFGLPMTVSRYVIINNDLQNQLPHLLFDLHHNFLHKYLLTASLSITFLSLLLETISSWAWFHFHHNFLNKYLLCKKSVFTSPLLEAFCLVKKSKKGSFWDFSKKKSTQGETTSTTASPLPPVLLHKEEEYEYYKVIKSAFKLEHFKKGKLQWKKTKFKIHGNPFE